MKRILTILFLALSFALNAQVVKDNFAAWANVSVSNGTNSITITAFQGNPKAFDQSWASTDLAVGDIVWANCSRFVVTAKAGLVLTLSNPDAAFSAVFPLVGQRVGLTRETTINGQLMATVPQWGDGNAGSIAGTDNTLAACIAAHYEKVNQLALLNSSVDTAVIRTYNFNFVAGVTLEPIDPTALVENSEATSITLLKNGWYGFRINYPKDSINKTMNFNGLGYRQSALGTWVTSTGIQSLAHNDILYVRIISNAVVAHYVVRSTDANIVEKAIEIKVVNTLAVLKALPQTPTPYYLKKAIVLADSGTYVLKGLNWYRTSPIYSATSPLAVDGNVVNSEVVWENPNISVIAGQTVKFTYQNLTWKPQKGELTIDDFGADNTGVIPINVAVEKALTYNAQNVIIFGKGTYRVSGTTLSIPREWQIKGQGVKETAVVTGDAITIFSCGNNSGETNVAYGVKLSDMRINAYNDNASAIKYTGTAWAKIENLQIEGNYGVSNNTNGIILDGGLSANLSTSITNVNCNHIVVGLTLQSDGTTPHAVTNVVSNNFSASCDFATFGENSKGIWIKQNNGQGCTFTGGNVESLKYGLFTDGAAQFSTFQGVRFEGNQQDYNFAAATTNFALIGCQVLTGNGTSNGGVLTLIGNSKSNAYPDNQIPNVIPAKTTIGESWTQVTGTPFTLGINGNIMVKNGINGNFLLDQTNTGTNKMQFQAGAGSSNYGGSIEIFGHSFPTFGGSVVVGLSQLGSNTGKFRVQDWLGSGAGTEFFTVGRYITTVPNNTGAFVMSSMTSTQRDNYIGNGGTNGSIVYNTTINKHQNRENGAWVSTDSRELPIISSANIVATAAQNAFTFVVSGVDATTVNTSRFEIYRNGILTQLGAGNDYTIGTVTSTNIPITWVGTAVAANDKFYLKIR